MHNQTIINIVIGICGLGVMLSLLHGLGALQKRNAKIDPPLRIKWLIPGMIGIVIFVCYLSGTYSSQANQVQTYQNQQIKHDQQSLLDLQYQQIKLNDQVKNHPDQSTIKKWRNNQRKINQLQQKLTQHTNPTGE